ncbi:MAG: N-acetylneuraminate epimerase [Methanomassiliicoccales archaeon PtaB.Bin215]|nr:MAG: N-acetylneuraminate epimerase [Methanomassiliicoccales archaeon PtaB.Bin215]
MRKTLAILLVMLMATGALTTMPAAEATATQWVDEGMMPGERSAFVGVELPDGRLFVALGQYNRNDTWIFDPNDDTWARMSDSPVAGGFSASAYLNGKVYVFGIAQGSGFYDRTLIYDVQNDSWTTGPLLPDVRVVMSAAAMDGRFILLAGGYNYSAYAASTCYLYDTVDNVYIPTSSLPEGRSMGTMIRDGDRIHYFGGIDPSSVVRDEIFGFDIASRTWSTIGHMPSPRACMAGAAGENGILYLLGGGQSAGFNTPSVSSCWAWNSRTGDFWAITDLPVTVRYASAFLIDDGRLICMGGNSGDTVFSHTYSLQTEKITVDLTTSTVGQGESAWMMMTFIGQETTIEGTVYLVRNDVVWGSMQFSYPTNRAVMMSFTIPATLPAGVYTIEFGEVELVGLLSDYYIPSLSLTVTDSASAEELAESLEQQIAALEDELTATRAELMAQLLAAQDAQADAQVYINASLSSIQAALDSLELQLALVGGQLDQAQAEAELGNQSLALLSANVSALMSSLAQLQEQLNDAQEAIDEANLSLASGEDADDLRDQLDGKLDAWVGYAILVAVLACLVMSAVALAIMLRRS